MRTLGINELLTWAFTHELPKGGGVDGLENINSAWRMLEASSWGKITAFAELGTMIDRGAGEGGNFFIEQGAPHDDAIAVGRAVMALATFDIEVPKGWYPLADWPDPDGRLVPLADQAVAQTVQKFLGRITGRNIVGLVVRQAILGTKPDWRAEPPKLRMVGREGRPQWFIMRTVRDNWGVAQPREVGGYNPKSGRPHRGAYRRYEFSADPSADILSRLDYQIWIAALAILRDGLGGLAEHRLLPWELSPTPWMEGRGLAVRLVKWVEKGGERRRQEKSSSAC